MRAFLVNENHLGCLEKDKEDNCQVILFRNFGQLQLVHVFLF